MEILSDPKQLIELVVFVGTAVWAVSKIRSTTEVLSVSMNHLTHTMNRLDQRVETAIADLGGLNERMIRLETRFDMNTRAVRSLDTELKEAG